ncbi:MAG: hypothetical protein JST92_18625, partial [Deltaproteobacteria bacterium]|nr:hypothetical protein [Deltaproteobacteria bacterium]
DTSQLNHGGVVGGMNAYLNQTTRVSQAISRATFANNGNGSNTYGGLIGGLGTWRDENGVPYPNQHVYVSDSYAETDSPDSGLFGFIDNEGDAHVDRVFAFANAGSGFCIVPPPCCSTTTTGLSTSGIFYNRDVCREVDTSGATTQPPGTGLAQSSFASSASFPGYDFSTNGLWKQGPRHPQLRWELESAPSLTLTDLPAQLAFDRSANLTLTVNASLQAALIQVSYDGIHWFTITTLGPMSPGTTFFSLENLGVIGTAYLRAVAIEPDGTEAVYDLGRTQYVECDPTIGPFGGGKGTASDPLRICSVTQLQAVNNYQGLLAQSYKLTQDLDLTGSGTQPLFIQVPGSRFDGGGHLIDNFQYTQADTSNTEYDKGLFGYIGDYNATTGTAPVTVAHLRVGVSGVSAPNSMNVGGFAGHLGRDAVIDDVHVLLHGDIGGLAQIGGLAGFNDTGAQVTNSSVASATPGAGSVTCLNPAQGGATGGAFGYFGGDATGIDVRDVAISCVVQDLRFSGNAGGIAGSVSGSLTNVSAHQVRVTSPIYAGGISGNLSGPVQSALVEDSLVQGSTTSTEQGDQIGGAVGATFTGASVDGLTVSGVTVTSQYNVGGAIGLAYQGGPVVLANARILDTHVIGVGPAGGAIGNLSSGDVHDVFVDANSTVTADNNCAGGLSGAVDPNLSWTLTRISVAAHLDSGPSGTSGGIFCAWYPNDGVFASADAIASHVVFEGNLNYVAGFIGNLNANGVTGLSVTDVDIQSTLAGSSGPAMTGGVFGSVTGSNFTAQLTHTVVDAALPSGACFAGFNSALITASESYWNSTRCGGSPGMGTGVTDASFAKTASFPGLDFGSTWSIRDGHPGLRFEQ